MKLEHSFEVPASPATTLTMLLDAEKVIPCMPGATLTEIVNPTTWKASMAVKLGPVGMQFLVDVKMLDRDDEQHSVRLGVSGRDTRGKGGAEGTVDSVLSPVGTGTRVDMVTDLRFSGQVAQLGRPGVVQDVSNKLVDQFADCIKAQLSESPDVAAAAMVEAQKPVSGFSLAIAALASVVKRLFGRGSDRNEGGSA